MGAESARPIPKFVSGGTFGGYSGYFAMPGSAVIPEGDMQFSFATGAAIPRQDLINLVSPQSDNYTSLIGILPGCEVGLSFLLASPLNGNIDDRTVAVKYSPPGVRPLGFNVALGNTDVHGTGRRGSRYVVAGRQFGDLSLDLGYLFGNQEGVAVGGKLRVRRNLGLMAELCGGVSRGGLYASVGRATVTAGYGSDKAPVASFSYTFPLRNEPRGPKEGENPSATPHLLAGEISKIGGGRAEAIVHMEKLFVSYEDVEGRDPVATLGRVLRACLAYQEPYRRVRVTVRRLGQELLTLECLAKDLRGFMDDPDEAGYFGEHVTIVNGSMGEIPAATAKAGRMTNAIVTVRPTVKYRLGTKDQLPHTEYLETKLTAVLPGKLLATVAANAAVNQRYTDAPFLESPTFSLYRAEPVRRDLWAMGGLERVANEPLAAGVQFSYLPKGLFRASARISQNLEDTNREPTYAVEAGLEDPKGSYYGFARTEKFRLGDTGQTFGLTRRFGQTWVTLQSIRTNNSYEDIERVGVNFQIPLPGGLFRSRGVAFTAAPTTNFSYNPRTAPRPSLGAGEPRPSVFSVEEDLTFRGQLTERFLRQHLLRLRG